jgi:hypothetical protein
MHVAFYGLLSERADPWLSNHCLACLSSHAEVLQLFQLTGTGSLEVEFVVPFPKLTRANFF